MSLKTHKVMSFAVFPDVEKRGHPRVSPFFSYLPVKTFAQTPGLRRLGRLGMNGFISVFADDAFAAYYVRLCPKRSGSKRGSTTRILFRSLSASFCVSANEYNTDDQKGKGGRTQTDPPRQRQASEEITGQADRGDSFAHVAQVFGDKFFGNFVNDDLHGKLPSLESVGGNGLGRAGKMTGVGGFKNARLGKTRLINEIIASIGVVSI